LTCLKQKKKEKSCRERGERKRVREGIGWSQRFITKKHSAHTTHFAAVATAFAGVIG